MKRLLREPLLHFLLLGLAVFAAYAVYDHAQRGSGTRESSKQIQLTLDELSQLVILFQSQWRREPTPTEMQSLVEGKVQEEVLYREAVAMGLDKDDTIVKRRMAQKMQFLAEDVAAAHEPTTAELKSWYGKNGDKFTVPGRVTFRQLYFSPDRLGSRAQETADKALVKLAGQPVDSRLATSLTDSSMLPDYYGDRPPEQLAKEFGPQFAQDVFKLKPGSWQGPIVSGFGWHLVFVDSNVPGRAPTFEEVEPDVKVAWLAEQKAQAWKKAYESMRAKYTVLVPAPPEDKSGRASAPPPPKANPAPEGKGTQ